MIMQMKKDSIFTYSGRINRMRFFYYFIASVVLYIAGYFLTTLNSDNSFILLLLAIFIYLISGFTLITGLVKRLHDVNRSGWWWLLSSVPLVDVVMVIYLLVAEGTKGKNKYD